MLQKQKYYQLLKHFPDFLKDKNQNSFFLAPTNESEVQNITSSLNLNKSVGPNSIPTRILKLFKIGISTQLAEYLTSHFLKASFQLYLK